MTGILWLWLPLPVSTTCAVTVSALRFQRIRRRRERKIVLPPCATFPAMTFHSDRHEHEGCPGVAQRPAGRNAHDVDPLDNLRALRIGSETTTGIVPVVFSLKEMPV